MINSQSRERLRDNVSVNDGSVSGSVINNSNISSSRSNSNSSSGSNNHNNHNNNNSNNNIKILLPGYNYEINDRFIIEFGSGENGIGFNTTLPPDLQPFFNSPNEYRTIINLINRYKAKSITTFTILISLHLVVIMPFIFILIFFGVSKERYKADKAPFFVSIALLAILFISVFVMFKIRTKYIKKDIEEYHSQITNRYAIRGLQFVPTLILKRRNFLFIFKEVFQTETVIIYPQKINNNNQNNNNNNLNINSSNSNSSNHNISVTNENVRESKHRNDIILTPVSLENVDNV
ncbi:hypothetical protein ACTFIW_009870 [Dictyostelium discoideum]